MTSLRQVRREELDKLLNTFTTEGHDIFLTDCMSMLTHLRDTAAADCDTGDKWLDRRGRIQMLETIMSYSRAAMSELDNFDDMVFEDEEPAEAGNSLEQ